MNTTRHRPSSRALVRAVLPLLLGCAMACSDPVVITVDTSVANDTSDTSAVTDTGTTTDTTTVSDTATGTDTLLPDAAPDVDATPPGDRWHVVHEELPAAFLSVWGRDPGDVWLAGADKGDGAWAVHGDASGWERLDLRAIDPTGGTLWWVHGPDETSVWFAGDHGRVFRWDRVTETATAIPTGTDATLYGIWGVDDSMMWAVGGTVGPGGGPPALVVIVDGVGQQVAQLPAGIPDDVVLFKVWGTATDDVWAIGEEGTILHWGGTGWTVTILEDGPRLVTVNGRGPQDPQDVVVVGGSNQARMFARDGGAWAAVDLGPYAALNGVSVGEGGQAFAAGILNAGFRRGDDGAWAPESGIPLGKDWHGVWVDGRGDVWLAGGNLLSATQLDAGALVRWGPDRTDVPSGAVRGLDPIQNPESDVVEGTPDVVEPTPDVAEPAPEVVEDVSDVAEPTPEVVEDVADSVGPMDVPDASDVADTADTSGPPTQLILGQLAVENDPSSFSVLTPGQSMEVVQGAQGGQHVEIAMHFPADSELNPLETPITVRAFIGGVERGILSTLKYPARPLAGGGYRTNSLPVVLDDDDGDFSGLTATLQATVIAPGGVTLTAEIEVFLVDNF